jgi:hypothetical protein
MKEKERCQVRANNTLVAFTTSMKEKKRY